MCPQLKETIPLKFISTFQTRGDFFYFYFRIIFTQPSEMDLFKNISLSQNKSSVEMINLIVALLIGITAISLVGCNPYHTIKVIEGSAVTNNIFAPYQVSLQSRALKHFCGGAIIISIQYGY